MSTAVAALTTLLVGPGDPPAPLYAEEVTDGLLARVVIASGLEPDALPASLQGAILRVATRAGCSDDRTPAENSARLAAYFEQHPLPPTLEAALSALTREHLAAGDVDTRLSATRLLGEAASKLPVGHGPTPAGAMKASPLARFTAQVPPKKP